MVVTPLKKKKKEEHPKKKYRELEGCAASTPTSIYLELEINFPGEVIVRTERKLVFSFSRSKAVTTSHFVHHTSMSTNGAVEFFRWAECNF